MEYKFINIEYLDSVSGGDLAITKEIIDMFREQVLEIYNEMKSLFDEKKYASLGLLAHKAKSSVAIMGMNDLASMLKTFELQSKEGENSGDYLTYIERFRVETTEAVTELDDLLKKRSNDTDGQY